MKILNPILNRKIGAFEVLVSLVPVAYLFYNHFTTLALAGAAGLFYFAKREFKGEFSLLDLQGLITKKENEQQ